MIKIIPPTTKPATNPEESETLEAALVIVVAGNTSLDVDVRITGADNGY